MKTPTGVLTTATPIIDAPTIAAPTTKPTCVLTTAAPCTDAPITVAPSTSAPVTNDHTTQSTWF